MFTIVGYRLSGQGLTTEGFLLDYNTEASKKDFVAYMEAKIYERYRKGKTHKQGISENTRKNHLSSLICAEGLPPYPPLLQPQPTLCR
ncbi:hypothetical protein [Hymenobacter latericus]|uniref:hypothetical protein n=1 Tax=Hymenobacter sp. YIM 151858-1 TaxID=2987688 RepID=UPI0022280CF3|nr:hypothetical protein [Hymenobacter sp. YIM 151858-1]UYZ61190.1 hypothetical protein OIS50_19665 [Hymenobacter sp. YIM 151858-1]